MKIALIHDYLTKIGGAQNVLKVFHEMYPEAPVYTLLYDKDGTKGEFESYKIITSKLQNKPAILRKRIKLLLSHLPEAVEEFDLSGFDIVISSSNSFAHGVITRPDTFHLCYCYSPMRYAWDWHAEYLVENHLDKGLISLAVKNALKNLREWDFLASSRVDQYVAISNTVQRRIQKYYRRQSSVIYPPAEIDDLLSAKTQDDDYYLIISTLTPYKKIDLAIEAFNGNSKKLIIVGEGSDMERLRKISRSSRIEFFGYVGPEQKRELLANCRALIFPGEEDFGLTPIEAMACGKPVIAFARGGVAESVIEGKTGYFFGEITSGSLNKAIDKLEREYGIIDPDACRRRAKQFSKYAFLKSFSSYLEKSYKEFHDRKI